MDLIPMGELKKILMVNGKQLNSHTIEVLIEQFLQPVSKVSTTGTRLFSKEEALKLAKRLPKQLAPGKSILSQLSQ